MKRNQKTVRFLTSAKGRKFLVWGLSAMMLTASVPMLAESPMGGGKNSNSQVVNQTKTVTGTVLDETGEPLIGVSVLVQGTTTGTITDFDGKFSLNVPANATIVVSYIGYQTQNIKVGNQSDFRVQLKPDNQLLDEVVVIGYGTVKKRDLTGAVASVKSEDITLNPGSNPMDALQGKIAGLDITNSSGQAGSSPTIQLRGTRSLQTDKDGNISSDAFKPTYIIDGMPGDISTLNPNDIESIEVLKDASSTAIYGSSGANGVVIVTTKSAKTGKPVVNFNAYVGTTLGATKPDVLSGDAYVKYVTDAYKVNGITNQEEIFGVERYNAIQNNQWVNWGDEVLHSGLKQNYSISVAGGTEKTKAYFSLNYLDEQSQYKNDNYTVYSTRVRVDQEISKWVNAGVNVQASYSNKNARSGVLEDALFATPLGVPYNEDGTINSYPIPGSTTEANPMADEQDGVFKNNTKSGKIYVDAYLEWKPIKGLSLRSQLGGNYTHSRSGKLIGGGSYNVLNGTTPYGEATNNTSYNYKWENIITYHNTFNDVHDLTVTGVSTWNYDRNEKYYIYGENPATNNMLWYALENANNKKLTSSYLMSKGFGLIGRINYSFMGKYLFSASIRYDGSSRLAKGNKWDTFPAVSLGWRISDEKFMEGTKNWLDNLKIRAGYGVAGTTAGISEYSSMMSLRDNVKTVLGGEAASTSGFTEYITNPTLSWEKTKDLNIGLDASFLKNRIDMTLDLYRTKTTDVIVPQSLPTSVMGTYSGTTPYKINKNAAETENKGIELAINSRNIVKKDFSWSSTVTFTANKGKVTSLIEGQDMIFNAKNGDMVFKVGETINAFYKYKVLGIWQWSERETAALFGCEPGDIKLDLPSVKKDADGYYYLNADGERTAITAEQPYQVRPDYDRQVIGHSMPDWTLGFKNNFKYKNFDLSVFMYARWGQTMNYGKVIGKYSPNPDRNIPTYFTYYDKTIEADQNVLFYAIDSSKGRDNYTGHNSMWYVDGSFFKLKNVTLGYTLPEKWIKKTGISNLRIYATLTNLFVYSPSKYVEDYDPEMNGSIDFPLSRDCIFGLNVTF